MRRVPIELLAACLALPYAAAHAVSSEAPIDPRSLPTLVERWSVAGPLESMRVASDGIYILGAKGVMALEPESGAVRWNRAVGERECCGFPFGVFGDVVALANAKRLALLDRATGNSRGEVELPAEAVNLVGPPLIAETISDSNEYSLVAIDSEKATLAATRALPASTYDLAVVKGVVLVSLPGSADGLTRFEGFDARSLALLWTVEQPASSSFRRFSERLWIESREDDCSCGPWRPIDPRNGELGAALALLPNRNWPDSSLEFQYDSQEGERGEGKDSEEGSFVLFHLDPRSAEERWRVTLPGRPGRLLRSRDLLVVPLRRGQGRELLAFLDTSTGEADHLVFGLPVNTSDLATVGSLLIAFEPAAVHAYEIDRFGAPERESRSVASEVERILSGSANDDSTIGGGDAFQRVAELALLGQPACQYVVARLPELSPTSLAAAATFIESERCTGSAAALAELLSKMSLAVDQNSWGQLRPPVAVLSALSAVGTSVEIPALASVAANRGLDVAVRAEAWMALVGIGGPAGERALGAVTTEPPPARSELEIPTPLSFLSWIGKPEVDDPFPSEPKAQEEYYRRSELRRAARGAADLHLPDGTQIVVYRGATIGSEDDLWLARVDGAGRLVGGPWFTGHRLNEGIRPGEEISVAGTAEVVTIRGPRGAVPFTLELSRLTADSDHDGLTDLVEQRLNLNPTVADSDGDGIADGVDPAPNAALSPPRNDEERRLLALFEQFFRLEWGQRAEKDHTAMFVWGDAALEWRGRAGPTLTLPQSEMNHFLETTGTDGIAHLSVTPWRPGGDGVSESGRDSCPISNAGEFAYGISVLRGGLNAAYYCAVMRQLGDHWFVRRLRLVGVS